MDLGIADKTVLITGATKGIGKEIALKFAEEGGKVAITYYSDAEGAAEVKQLIQQKGATCLSIQMDLGNIGSINDAIKSIAQTLGGIDILVNNAVEWVGRSKVMENKNEEQWLRMINCNLLGTYRVTKAVLPYMYQKSWGRIIHISSDLAEEGMAGASAYTASKAALHGFSKSLSKEVAEDGIYSNVILPGLTLTERASQMFSPQFLEEFAQSNPTKRLGTPADVANLAVFLGSEANSFMNGEVIPVTGGR